MSEHSPATTSKIGGEPVEQTRPSSVQVLAEKAIEPASQAGEYVARNVHEYPLTTVLAAALIGGGIGYLLHTSWWQTSAQKKKQRRRAAKKAAKQAAKKAAQD